MATLARLFDFTPGGVIASGEVDAEFNQLVNALNGTSTSVNIDLRFSSATVPTLSVDQIGAGMIQVWKQAGSTLLVIGNTGVIASSVLTGTAPIQVSSTTVCPNLNADLLDGVQGGSYARTDIAETFDSNLIVAGDLRIQNNAPEVQWIDVNSSKTMRVALDNTLWNWINNNLVSIPLSMNTTTDVFTFGQIPVLPAANPTTANQAARKAFVDGRFTSWSCGWFYVVPPSAAESVESVGRLNIPTGMTAVIAINSITVGFAGGSHTSGGTLTFTIKRRNAAGTLLADVGTITINDSGPAINVRGQVAPGDTTLTAGDQIYPLLTTHSGTITEEGITVSVSGYQFLG